MDTVTPEAMSAYMDEIITLVLAEIQSAKIDESLLRADHLLKNIQAKLAPMEALQERLSERWTQ